MTKKYSLQLKSGSPIQVVFGISSASLNDLKSNGKNTPGYDWLMAIYDFSEQREEFLSGVDVDDAELIVTDEAGGISTYRFKNRETCDDDEDLSGFILFDSKAYVDAGRGLALEGINHIIVARLDIRYHNFTASLSLQDNFDPGRVSLKIVDLDSSVEVASLIYFSWHCDYQSSIAGLYYSRKKVHFETDYTSDAPEFYCLTKTQKGWRRDEELEKFFESDR